MFEQLTPPELGIPQGFATQDAELSCVPDIEKCTHNDMRICILEHTMDCRTGGGNSALLSQIRYS